jgi:hypothetical protein
MNWGEGFLVQQIASFESSSSYKVRIFLRSKNPVGNYSFYHEYFSIKGKDKVLYLNSCWLVEGCGGVQSVEKK